MLRLLVPMLAVVYVQAYGTGAPVTACSDQVPAGHGVVAQTSPFPYDVTPSAETVMVGKTVEITIRDADQGFFKGFFVQARLALDPDSPPAQGRFRADSRYKLVSCGGNEDSAITHKNNDDKRMITVNWEAPEYLAGKSVIFRVTLVKNKETFWVGHQTTEVRVTAAPAAPAAPEPEQPETTPEPEPEATPEPEPGHGEEGGEHQHQEGGEHQHEHQEGGDDDSGAASLAGCQALAAALAALLLAIGLVK